MQVKLNPRVVLEHLEANRILPADEFLLGIDADIQMIEKQIVVGPILTVRAAQDVSTRRPDRNLRRLRRRCLLRTRGGNRRRSLRRRAERGGA
jgi:hypothetical protein